jgi:hypothetical protein
MTYIGEVGNISQPQIPHVDEIPRGPAKSVAVVDVYPEERLIEC